jgi:hypothetical protein
MAGLTAAQLERVRGKLREAEVAIERAVSDAPQPTEQSTLEMALGAVRECQREFSEDWTSTRHATEALPTLEQALYTLENFAGAGVNRAMRHIQEAIEALRPNLGRA